MEPRAAPWRRRRVASAGAAASLVALAAAGLTLTCTVAPAGSGQRPAAVAVVPAPASLQVVGPGFALSGSTRIVTPADAAEPARIGAYLAGLLRPATGYALPVSEEAEAACRLAICLSVRADPGLGDEGYALDVTSAGVRLRASQPAGLFRGVQTLRQLLPARVERTTRQPGPWSIPGVRVVDRPRLAWRGASLDVARHFLSVADVKRYVELISLYKVDVLHLHLTDDQGWRIAIRTWPGLATRGGSTGVGGGAGGYYTQEDYAEI